MSTEVIIVRHGETDWNRIGRIQGHGEIDLNPRGRNQAKALAKCLAGERLDAIFSSDLARAHTTARAIAARTRRKLFIDQRLRECHLGVLAGLTHSEARARYPKAYAIYCDGIGDTPIPGGESPDQRRQRVVAAVTGLAERYRGGRLLVVTHGGPLDDCYRHATGMPQQAPEDFQVYNAGINRFAIEAGTWRLESWGEIGHLEQIGTLGNREL